MGSGLSGKHANSMTAWTPAQGRRGYFFLEVPQAVCLGCHSVIQFFCIQFSSLNVG